MAEESSFRYVPPVDPNIGRSFGRYIVRTLLGRGGMGAAYLAEHEAGSHVKCVIKVVLAELAKNPLVISRYKTETEAVSRLKHDNIVKLHDFGVHDDGQLFMCFEYIEGKSLERYVVERGGRLDVRKAAYFIFQLCDALQYAHERGVVHRDLKPDNLMVELSPPGSHLEERVKILDFGIAKVANTAEHTGSGVAMGTPRYMAPEQVTNAAAATSAADVFSLATIFYLLVTGKLPWGAPESDVAIYHLQKTQPPASPPEELMPPDVAAVVMRGLSIKPSLRPSTREFAVEIAAAISREDDLESGTEILKHVKRNWVTSSPPHVQTLPRPVVADPTTSLVASDVTGDAAATVQRRPSEIAASIVDLAITANARPRARAVATVAAGEDNGDGRADATSGSRHSQGRLALAPMPAAAAAIPAGAALVEQAVRPQSPVLAALPTGLLSHRFTVQELSSDASETREEPIAVASEIELAAGTPGPQPYAHSELPAVLVSPAVLVPNTQPLAVPPAADVHDPFRVPGESPPVLVFPVASPPRRGVRVAVASAVCIGAAVVVAWLVARAPGSGQGQEPARGSDPAAAPDVAGGKHAAGADEDVAIAKETGPAIGSAPGPAPVPPAEINSTASSSPSTPAVPAETRPAVGAEAKPPVSAIDGRGAAPVHVPAEPAVRRKEPARPMPVALDGQRGNTVTDRPQRTLATPPESSQRTQQLPAQPRSEARKGKITILVTPWALVWLDGKPLDQTPVVLDDVPAGRHHLRLQNSLAKKDETITIVVNPDQPTTIQRTW